MATWCKNILTISGQEKEVARFISENGNERSPLFFSKSIPEPDYLLEQDLNGLEEWRFAKWGTVEEAYIDQEIAIEKINDQVIARYFFSTLSDPADRWLDLVILKYPSISFCLVYGEGNLNVGGVIIAKDGQVISSRSGTARDYVAGA